MPPRVFSYLHSSDGVVPMDAETERARVAGQVARALRVICHRACSTGEARPAWLREAANDASASADPGDPDEGESMPNRVQIQAVRPRIAFAPKNPASARKNPPRPGCERLFRPPPAFPPNARFPANAQQSARAVAVRPAQPFFAAALDAAQTSEYIQSNQLIKMIC